MARIGTCQICGAWTNLTFEHVPPKSAFNRYPVLCPKSEDVLKALSGGAPDPGKGHISQKGVGGYTLCGPCNNKTGHWYGEGFVDWARQGLCVLDNVTKAPSLYYLFHIFPLRVLKQIACMFFSVAGPGFQSAQPELVRFVLNKEARHLPHGYRVFLCLNNSPFHRLVGVSARLNTKTGINRIFAEVAFPPFAYVLSLSSPPPDSRLVDISHFGEYAYNDRKDVPLRLPLLPVETALPGSY